MIALCRLLTDPRNRLPLVRSMPSFEAEKMRWHFDVQIIQQKSIYFHYFYKLSQYYSQTKKKGHPCQGQEKPVTIGTTKFRPVTSREKIYIEKNKKYWTNHREWSIDYGKFDKFKWKETLEITESAGIENLWLNNNSSKEVLRSLVPCAFMNLKILNLSANQIQSIEPISLLQAPNLERIEVNDNEITDIKALRKTIFDNITWLSLCNNPVTDWSILAQIYAPRLQRLQLKRNPFPLLDESLNWVLKMESRQIKRLDAMTFRRVPQQQVKEMIYERYTQISIEWSKI